MSAIIRRTAHSWFVILSFGTAVAAQPRTTAGTFETYDPLVGTFSTAGTTTGAIAAATLFKSGKVLLAGDASAIYDPVTGTLTGAGSVVFYEGTPSATLLANGGVFLAPAGTSGAELYEPASGAFRPAGQAKLNEFMLTASPLISGKVLVTQGAPECDYNGTDVQLYDPSTNTFSATGSLIAGRCFATATPLSDGTVLISGNWGRCVGLTSPASYNPGSGTFSETGAMIVASRYAHTATLLKDGRVLMAGGLGVATPACGNSFPSVAEVYTPKSVAPEAVLRLVAASEEGAVLHASTQQLVSPDNPGVAGEALEIYATGLIDGAVIPPQVAIGRRKAEVLFFGEAPGYAKLNRINVRVPAGIVPGSQIPVRLNYLSRPSNEVTISVR